MTENGSFNVYSRSQEYKFTPEGLVRKAGKPNPLKASEPQSEALSYKVCLFVHVICSEISSRHTIKLRDLAESRFGAYEDPLLHPEPPWRSWSACTDIGEGCEDVEDPWARSKQCGSHTSLRGLCVAAFHTLQTTQPALCMLKYHEAAMSCLCCYAGVQSLPGAQQQICGCQENKLL